MNNPEECVEEVARIIHDDQWAGDDWHGHTELVRDGWRDLARAALSAAAPHLMAIGFDEGWVERAKRDPFHRIRTDPNPAPPPRAMNPYRKEAL